MTKRVTNLTVSVAPELVGQLHYHACASFEGPVPPSIGVVHLQVYHHPSRKGELLSAMMLRKMVVEHQRMAVDLQMRVHQPSVVRRMPHQLLGAERQLVEVDGFGGVARAYCQMGGQAAGRLLEFKIVHSTHSLPIPRPALIGAPLSR
jgi:hypothetical protein